MLPKLFASWLVVLILLPFTAPFSTCDSAGFFGSTQGKHTPSAPRRAASLRERRHNEEDVTNEALVLNILCNLTTGRPRLAPLSRLPFVQTKAAASLRRFLWSGTSPGSIREYSVLTTILRL